METNFLSNEQLVSRAPSIGAVMAAEHVSDKYSFVPTLKAVDYIRDVGWSPVEARQSRALDRKREGLQKHMIRFSRPELNINGHRLEMIMFNSHDAGSSFQLYAGVFRFVCMNGMVVGEQMEHFRHIHVGFDPDAFVRSAEAMSSRMGELGEVIDDWQGIKLDYNERRLYAESAHLLVYPETLDNKVAPIKPSALARPRRDEDSKDDLWTTFNVVQENATKGGLRGRSESGRRMTTRPIGALDKDKTLNRALWTLTQKMAELKREQ